MGNYPWGKGKKKGHNPPASKGKEEKQKESSRVVYEKQLKEIIAEDTYNGGAFNELGIIEFEK